MDFNNACDHLYMAPLPLPHERNRPIHLQPTLLPKPPLHLHLHLPLPTYSLHPPPHPSPLPPTRHTRDQLRRPICKLITSRTQLGPSACSSHYVIKDHESKAPDHGRGRSGPCLRPRPLCRDDRDSVRPIPKGGKGGKQRVRDNPFPFRVSPAVRCGDTV